MSTTDTSRYIVGEVRAAAARERVSIGDLADQIGVSRATMHRRMSGETSFTVDELAAISLALNVAYATFWPGDAA